MPIILVFDTETTGLPPFKESGSKPLERSGSKPLERYNYFSEYPVPEEWPRIVQLSYILYDTNDMRVIYKTEDLDDIVRLHPGVHIPEEASKITGITNAVTDEHGKPIDFHIDRFIEYYNQCSLLVGHNVKFDINVLCAELALLIHADHKNKTEYERLYKKLLPVKKSKYVYESEDAHCTMKAGKPVCKLAAHVWKHDVKTEEFARYFKGPTLQETHQILFKQNVKGKLHNALVDISTTLRVYMMLAYNKDICSEDSKTPSNEEICKIINAQDITVRDEFPLQINLPDMITVRPMTKAQARRSEENRKRALAIIESRQTTTSKLKGGKKSKRKLRKTKKAFRFF